MPSAKLRAILIARSPFSIDEIDRMNESDGWKWVYGSPKEQTQDLPSICFTGFRSSEKDDLIIRVRSTGRFRVLDGVSANLDFLCCGDNAGPSKLAKAAKQGVAVIQVFELDSLLVDGLIPQE